MQTPERTITQIKQTRVFLLDLIKDLNIEQLNRIPEGFNNNVIWNIAHLTAAQENLCYVRSGLKTTIEERFFSPFLSGTKPHQFYNQTEIGEIYKVLLNGMDRLATDYSNGIFKSFTTWDKRYGMKLNSIEDAINFIPFHEAMHIGYIMALKKLV